MLNIILVSSSLVLLLIGYLGYRNFKNRNKIAKQETEIQLQKVAELEKEKQFLAIDAMLKGQEDERSRIAKDLHDGLGSLLAGTKLSLIHVKESLEMTKDDSRLFDKSLSMLDNTMGDLRKVAHNLMPEALVKFGLVEAVRDYCDSLQSSAGINVVFQQIGERKKLDNTAEIFIYRIIQELMNNVIRHAEARNVLVQLSHTSDRTMVTVEDDGKGFDKDSLKKFKGAGLANVLYRVRYLHGRLDINTAPGKGTSIHVELDS